jgi:hypothetical protein
MIEVQVVLLQPILEKCFGQHIRVIRLDEMLCWAASGPQRYTGREEPAIS